MTAVQRTKREQVRLRAAELFAQGYTDAQVAKELRVTRMSANRWHRAWATGGGKALASKGPGPRPEVARHEQLLAKAGMRLELDHYLEVLIRKPGALPGATALEQARAAGKFTPVHDQWWAAACKAHGDREGTRALIEVLLLSRHLAHEHVVAGLAAALGVGALTADAVALEARKAADADTTAEPVTAAEQVHHDRASVTFLTERRLAQLPPDTRPLPSVAIYDQLLRRRPHAQGEQSPASSRHRGLTEQASQTAVDAACRMLRLPTIRKNYEETAERAAREQMSYLGFLADLLMAECDDRARRRSERRIKAARLPSRQVAARVQLRRQPQRRPRDHPHPGYLRLGEEGPAALPDR